MRILAVNTDPFFQETLVQMQLGAPRDVIVMAETPKAAIEAIRTARTQQYDCFLIEGKMAKQDQASLIPDLRAQQRGATVPILVLTETLDDASEIAAQDPARLTGTAVFPLPLPALQDRIAEMCAPKTAAAAADVIDFDAPIPLTAELEVYDTPGIVTRQTLETYVGQLPRRKVFGSSCFGLAIRDIEMHHAALSAFDFHSLISDIADAISEEMQHRTALFAYMGEGVFVGLVEDTLDPKTLRTMRHINGRLQDAGITDGDGTPIDIRLSAGDAETFTWRSARTADAVLLNAKASAIAARNDHGKLRDQFWFMDRTA